MKNWTLFIALSFCTGAVHAQQEKIENAAYDPHDYFLQDFQPTAGNVFRSAQGIPGPMYWQNSASYTIHATLSEKDTSVSGDVKIEYTNYSPDSLEYLWLQLDQNIFNPSSRGTAASPAIGDKMRIRGFDRGGYSISGTAISYRGKKISIAPVISDTRMQIRLPFRLLPKGDKISIEIKYRFAIPQDGSDRMGRLYTKRGVIYEIAQWYPRMCVYDDVEGWNTLPYMGLGEFYCEYGDYDYYVSAPAEMIVYGSGDLQNAGQVLTPLEIKRLSMAAGSDQTIGIVNAGEIGKASMRPAGEGNLTWHFTMKHARDVAWAASKALVWDAARVNLPSGRKVLAMSAYPPESMGDTAWGRATAYLKSSMEIYSKNYFEYPWNNAVDIAASVTGMEYPGMIFNDYKEKKAALWFVIAHEIGHNWFPMIVGSNERKYMWQDEGFNSYINYQANEVFNQGEYARDPALFNKDHFTYLDQTTLTHLRDPLMTVSEAMDVDQHYQYYSKTAFGLKLLRDVVVGRDRFDYAFRKYIEAWAYKHPTPYDFFHCINNAAGEDLNWFWKEWFFTTWTLDQAVTEVKYVDNDTAQGAFITIQNKGKMILPVSIKIIQHNGDSRTIELPVEIWQRGGSWTFKYPSKSPIDQVILDPEMVLPDIDRSNNQWKK